MEYGFERWQKSVFVNNTEQSKLMKELLKEIEKKNYTGRCYC
ncbi:MAG: hypothetical protein IPL35_12785 [Sphingobacteriales bacterium]|nr:hypothetical protein [Sphingobacteriales bacterium]